MNECNLIFIGGTSRNIAFCITYLKSDDIKSNKKTSGLTKPSIKWEHSLKFSEFKTLSTEKNKFKRLFLEILYNLKHNNILEYKI